MKNNIQKILTIAALSIVSILQMGCLDFGYEACYDDSAEEIYTLTNVEFNEHKVPEDFSEINFNIYFGIKMFEDAVSSFSDIEVDSYFFSDTITIDSLSTKINHPSVRDISTEITASAFEIKNIQNGKTITLPLIDETEVAYLGWVADNQIAFRAYDKIYVVKIMDPENLTWELVQEDVVTVGNEITFPHVSPLGDLQVEKTLVNKKWTGTLTFTVVRNGDMLMTTEEVYQISDGENTYKIKNERDYNLAYAYCETRMD